jgi:hypothetical protein
MTQLHRRLPVLAAVCAGLLLSSACGTQTDVSSVWNNKVAKEKRHSLLVIAVVKKPENRRKFEDRFALELRLKGVKAATSYKHLPTDERLTEAAIRKLIADRDIDGVVITTMLGVSEQEEYVAPQYRSHGGYYDYYGYSYGNVYDPGHIHKTTRVVLETQVYELSDGEMMWAGQSETFDPHGVRDAISSVSKAVARQMSKDGVI